MNVLKLTWLVSRKSQYEQSPFTNQQRDRFDSKEIRIYCFIVERQRGSHVFLKHTDGKATVVPVHSGETIGPGLLSKILRDVEMTKDELLKIHQR